MSAWNWTDICPTGLQPWLPPPDSSSPDTGARRLAPCFQKLCLQTPLLVLLALLSAYHLGRLPASQHIRWRRFRRPLWAVNLRMLAVGLLALLPVIRKVYDTREPATDGNPAIDTPPLLDSWLAAVETIAFMVHFAFLRRLRQDAGLSHRGPLSLCVIWITLAVLAGVSVGDPQWSAIWPITVATIAMHTLYAGSLLLPDAADDEDPGLPAAASPDAETLLQTTPTLADLPLGAAQDTATNPWSQFTFSWAGALINKGLRPGGLRTVDDLFRLPASLNVDRLAAGLRRSLDRSPQLLWALHRALGCEFYAIGLLQLLSDVAGFAGPLLLGALLRHEAPPALVGQPAAFDPWPYWYALGLFASTLVAALSQTHFGWRAGMIITKMHISLVSAIYGKALEARSLDDAKPEILNLMSTDTDRVMDAVHCFHALWSVPLQLGVSLWLLYQQVGLAFAAGLAFVLALVPLNQWLVKRINYYEKRMMEAKDERMALATEALSSAKSIKLMAWERLFMAKIRVFRGVEVNYLRAAMNLNAMVLYLWSATPVLMSLLTFGTSVLTGHRLTAASTFTAVALMNMLMAPLNVVPWALSGLTDAWVSMKRIQALLDLPSIDLPAYYTPIAIPPPASSKAPAPPTISLQAASFTFDNPRSRDGVAVEQAAAIVDFRLAEVTMCVRRGQLVCLRGPLGSGKTAVLNAVLAKMQNTAGSIGIADIAAGFGYVAQSAWLQRGTIRENIVWGAAFEEARYKRVLHACALTEDLRTLGGDLTGVGEAGATLSGGQRARVALARAVYQDKAVYLLDDILSALDGHVANHIVRNCVLGVLADRTRLIVTEHEALLGYADQVFEVADGRVTEQTSRVVPEQTLDEFLADSREEAERFAATYELTQDAAKVQETSDSVLDEEGKEHGQLDGAVFGTYWRAMGWAAATMVLVFLVAQRLTESLTDLWLAHWVTENALVNRTGEWLFLADKVDPSSSFNLEVYVGLGVANSLATLGRTFLFAFVSVRASRVVHERMLGSVFWSQFQFFDITPLGRLLNRFSTDIDIVDNWLPFAIGYLMSQLSGLIASLLVCIAALPWLLLLVAPLAPIYLRLQARYRRSSREVQRLSSNALSPLYAHFTETLQGLSTVRAMRAAGRFRADFAAKLERCIRAQITSYAAGTWLTLRLQFMGALLVGGCGLVAAATAQHASQPGLVGLAISYALQITQLLAGVMYAVGSVEQQMVAVERIKKYCELEPEPGAGDDGEAAATTAQEPSLSWPEQGVIRFREARLQYRANLSPALHDVSLETKAGERLGVAGRTGAGKSSLLAALFRVAPLSAGQVTVDGVDVAQVPLAVLRRRLTLVPQQPFLFAGTVRENLDPAAELQEPKLWAALEQCRAAELVRTMGGLEGKLEKGGGNLSAGQKQLLCLARAVLRGSRVVCIDEGTANLDAKAEREIQRVLREAFGGATVLLIAHRMTSLLRADRVVVMQEGRVVERGEVALLREDEGSVFWGMMQEQRQLGQLAAAGPEEEEEEEAAESAEHVAVVANGESLIEL